MVFGGEGGTTQAVTLLSDHIRMQMDKGNYTGVVYVDLQKAFDTVDHSVLLSKLPAVGIQHGELEWIKDYLFNRKQYVKYDGMDSDERPVTSGVPQGSILGPLLFLVHINDIGMEVKICNMLLYADDMVIFYSDKDPNKIEDIINEEFNYVIKWLEHNNLSINLKKGKTEAVLYGTKKKLSNASEISIMAGATKIENATVYEYLGVLMDNSLTFKQQSDKLFKKAMSRVRLLALIRSTVTTHVAESIFKIMIKPIVLYCHPLLLGSDTMINRFQKIQDRSFKIVFGEKSINTWISIKSACNRLSILDVWKCLNGTAPETYKNYFKRISHNINTRNNMKSVILPKVKTECGKKSFMFQGAKLFNILPTDIKEELSITKFRFKIQDIFDS